MALILVVEQEERYIERIRDALGSEGWRSQVVSGHPEALRAASSEAPNLVLVNSELEGATGVFASFARSNGGPGVVAMVSERQAAEATAARGADEVLAKPFTDQDLRLVVRRILSGTRQAAAGRSPIPAPPAGPADVAHPADAKFTSAQIFGDLVLEIENEMAGAPSGPPDAALAPPPPRAVEVFPTPAVEAPPPPPPLAASPQPPAPAAARARPLDDAEIQRRLEQTLSGVFGPGRPTASPTPTPRRPRPRDVDIEQLLSETLSELELGSNRIGGSTAARPPLTPGPELSPLITPSVFPTPKPPAPATPQAQSPADFRQLFGDLGLSELEELARPTRGPAAQAVAEPPPEAAGEPDPTAAPGPDAPAEREPDLRAEAEPPAPAEPEELTAPEPDLPPPAFDFALPELESLESFAFDPLPPRDETPAVAAVAPSPPAESFEQFGQYALLDRIAVGGMAEVWKARMRGVEGFQKTVAIKRILPHLTDSSDFISMFVDEAKLAAQLSHPNIIHIYDLGKIGQHYYIAMEYVEGQNLRTILNGTAERAMPLPVGLVLLIGARLASALDYAHRKRDFDHREMGLVHRDVSPQNVLISYDGDIKLCDFGIAKAVANASRTQMGALKGKLQYMSPEQAWGRPVDPRSDIFSLGSLLFEMSTGRRLFTGDNEISVLEAVRECHVEEPSELNAEIPAEFNAIILKALAKDPADRYQHAGELQQELEQVLYSRKPTPGPADLAMFLEHLRSAPAVPPTPHSPPAPPAPSGMPSSTAEESAAAWGGRQGVTAPVETPAAPVETPAAEESAAAWGGRQGATAPVEAPAAQVETPTAEESAVAWGGRQGATAPVETPVAWGGRQGVTAPVETPAASSGRQGVTAPVETPAAWGGRQGATAPVETPVAWGGRQGATAPVETPAPVETSGHSIPRSEPAALEAVVPRGPVIVEEGGGRGRWLLIAAILLALAAGVAAALYFSIARPRGPAAERTPAAATPGEPAASPAEDGSAPPAESPAGGPAVEAPAPGTAAKEPAAGEVEAAAAAPTPAQLESLVEAELARREEQMRKKFDAEQKRLEEALARAKAQQQAPPPATGGGGGKAAAAPPSGGTP